MGRIKPELKGQWMAVLSVVALFAVWAWSGPGGSDAVIAAPADLDDERPIAALDTVWIEQMTWMEVRDALAEGKTTALVSTGGIEDNGPYLATGKHNYILADACEAIARELGNALCAPIVKLVPQGHFEPASHHMRYPGTIGLRESTFEAVLEDVGESLRSHGFEHIVYFGDSGGNQAGMAAVADRQNIDWSDTSAHFVPSFYGYSAMREWMNVELGIVETVDEGLHDDFVVTALLMARDPALVRHAQRVTAGRASINGVAITPKAEVVEVGRRISRVRVAQTVKAIEASVGGAHR